MKVIITLAMARYLLEKGNKMVDVGPSRKKRGNLVFVFEDTEKLNRDMDGYFSRLKKEKELV